VGEHLLNRVHRGFGVVDLHDHVAFLDAQNVFGGRYFPFVIATSNPGCGVTAEQAVARRAQMPVPPRATAGRVLANMLTG